VSEQKSQNEDLVAQIKSLKLMVDAIKSQSFAQM
jgi:hypothetical protein